MSQQTLPPQYAHLEQWAEVWALDSEYARRDRRMRSSQTELVTFHAALIPELDAIIQYLNGFSLDDLPPAEQRLLDLALSVVEVSPAVELFHNPWPKDVYPWEKFSVAY